MTPDNSVRTFRTPGKRRRRDKGSGGLFLRKGAWVAAVRVKDILGEVWSPDSGIGGRRGVIEVSARDKNACLAKRDKLIAELRDGIVPMAKGETVADLMWYWLDTIMKPHLGPGTYATYRATIVNQIVAAIGDVDKTRLTSADVRFMHQFVLDDGKSTRTAQIAYDRLNQALTDLRKEVPPKVRINVCESVRRPSAVSEERETHTTEQARTVLLTAREDRLLTRWAFAYMTGARQGECLGLEDDRIDLDKLTVDFSWQLKRLPLKKGADIDAPDRFDVPKGYRHRPLYRGYALARVKTKKSRVGPIPEPLAALLQQYLASRPANEYGLAWVDDLGRPIDAKDDLNAWYALQARAGVPSILLHGARHTCNSLLQEMGVLEDVRMQILGQSTVTAQRAYQHLSLGTARAALGNLDVLLDFA